MGSEAAGNVNVLLGPVAKGGSQEVQDIVVRLQKWFDEVLRTYNEALPWQDDLPGLLSEMYVKPLATSSRVWVILLLTFVEIPLLKVVLIPIKGENDLEILEN